MAININALNNILEFLQRVPLKGVEAFAFVEAYSAVQTERQQQQAGPGLPFALLDSVPNDNTPVALNGELFGKE